MTFATKVGLWFDNDGHERPWFIIAPAKKNYDYV